MDPNHNSNQQEYVEEDEIDVIQLAKTLWNDRKTIIKITVIFMVLGLFAALFSAPKYTATTVIRPVLSSSKSKLSGSLGGLAAMAGINLGGSGSSSAELPPSLYPQILESFSFRKQLLQTPLQIQGLDTLISYQDYFSTHKKRSFVQNVKRYTLGLPGLLISSLRNNAPKKETSIEGIAVLSKEEAALFEQLKSQISLEINEKEGYISLSATLPEALAATQLLLNAQAVLQEAVIAFKIKKATADLGFIKERYVEKKVDFEKAQDNLARYRDANRNVTTALAQTESERLESEYQLAFAVYSELAKQVETQKIQVKEDTPVFAVLQEAIVPLEKSGTSKRMILIIWTFLGGIVGIGFVYSKGVYREISKKWNTTAAKNR